VLQVKTLLVKYILDDGENYVERGYKYGDRLGRDGKGFVLSLELDENKGRYGLGYKASKVDKKIIVVERRERSLARLEGHEPRIGRNILCHIKQSFHNARWINVCQMATIKRSSKMKV